jgi:hypothetical protein
MDNKIPEPPSTLLSSLVWARSRRRGRLEPEAGQEKGGQNEKDNPL